MCVGTLRTILFSITPFSLFLRKVDIKELQLV
jgi:hypothetical protein